MARNVILVVIDALRRDRLGVLDDDETLTPNIDELADEGVVFENAFACANATDPSVTTIHTGRDPSTVVRHHGPYVTDSEKRRAEAVTKVPEVLRASGLKTVAAGRLLSRWHKSGFDQYPESALHRHRRRAIGERLEAVHPGLRSLARGIYERLSGNTSTPESDAISHFLQSIDDGPFYGFIHLMDTHAPYEPGEALVDEILDRRDYPRDDLEAFFERHRENAHVREFIAEHADKADYEYGFGRLIAKYDAAVVEADRKVGRLVEELRRRERLEDTTLIITSDHGESLDEHGIYFDHHGLYDESIRVPLIISGPGQQSRRTEFVQLCDLAPTIVDLFDLDATFDGEGRSLQPLLDRDREWGREFVVAHEAHTQSRVAIRTAEWKYIKHVEDPVLERERGDSYRCGYCNTVHGAKRELYHLSTDPGESENVVEQYPDRAEALDSELTTYLEGLDRPTTDHERTIEYEEESEVMERLEDLGYR